MIDELLPVSSACAEGRGSEADERVLFPEERALTAAATSRRRAEFAGGRACAHEAMQMLGLPPAPVGRGERGEPIWPAGVRGSITHCDGYRACAVGRANEWLTLAIDAEPHEPVSTRLLERIAGPSELRRRTELAAAHPKIHWDKLLFSAKECVFKALSPAATGMPTLTDAELEIDADRGTFAARPAADDISLKGRSVGRFEGRWLVRDGLVLTAIAVPA